MDSKNITNILQHQLEKKSKTITFTTITVVICCLLLCVSPLAIVSTIIAVENQDDPCQKTDTIGLTLSNWLLGYGIAYFINIGLAIIITILTFSCGILSEVAGTMIFVIGFFIYHSINSIFSIIYSTIGAVILYRSNLDCLNNGTSLGVMVQIVLCLMWLSILSSFNMFNQRDDNK